MVPYLCRIVEERAVGSDDDLLERHVLIMRSGNQSVEIVDVGLKVLTMVIINGFLAHARLQRIGRIGERG